MENKDVSLFEFFGDLSASLRENVSVSAENRDRIIEMRKAKDRALSLYATKSVGDHRRLVEETPCPVRSDFERDLGRIVFSQAFRRLKHKTQVFFNPSNDHICSRLEHVIYVNYIASTIGGALNLNKDLIQAIALGHDVGHAPFGHSGEHVLNEKLEQFNEVNGTDLFFEHEAHSLRVLDVLEEHGDTYGLNLTFEVRDGILSHCGETYGEVRTYPDREKDMARISYLIPKIKRGSPATLEGCVVRLADKIAYVGRDIEDAFRMGIVDESYWENAGGTLGTLGTSNSEIINTLVEDVVENSYNKDCIAMSDTCGSVLSGLLTSNLKEIYQAPKVKTYEKYSYLVIESLFDAFLKSLESYVKGKEPEDECIAAFWRYVERHPETFDPEDKLRYPVYVVDYIAGMTDDFAIKCFEEMFRDC